MLKNNYRKKNFFAVLGLFFMSQLCSICCAAEEKNENSTYELKLDIAQAITLSLAKNYFVRVESFEPKIAWQDIEFSLGEFDPVVGFETGKNKNDSLSSSGESVIAEQTVRNERLYLNGKFPWGTQYFLQVSNEKFVRRYSGNSRDFDVSASIEVTQPLLRGFGVDSGLASTRLAKNRYQIKQAVFEDLIMGTVRDVAINYANLYSAKKNLELRIESRNLAQRLLDDNRKRVAVGRDAESEIITAEAGVASREDAVINAEKNLRIQENRFKLFVSDDVVDLLAYRILIEDLNIEKFSGVDVKQDFLMALRKRPDYLQAKLGLNASHIAIKRDKRNLLPSLDISIRASQFGASDTSRSKAQDSFSDAKADGLSTQLNFSMPILNRSNRAQLRSSELVLAQKELDIKQLEQAILVDIDNAAVRLDADYRRVAATQRAVDLAEKSLFATEQLRKAGRRTSFVVLRFQNDLANAQNAYLQALSAYYRSYINYRYEIGEILEYFNVDLIDTPQK